MKKYGSWFLLLIFLYAIQTSILPNFGYNGISADLLLLLIVSFALLEGSKYGTIMALGAGLLKGIASGTFFGVDAFAFIVIAFIIGRFYNQVYREARFLPLVAAGGATIIYYATIIAFLFMMGYRFSFVEHAQNVLLPMIVHNFIFSYPVHKLTVKMDALTRTEWSKNGS